VALVVALVAGGWVTWTGWGNPDIGVFVFVAAGWLVSLCLHEFAHAYVAYRSGDRSVVEQGYLTLNPLRYSDALLSIALPLLFVLVGGLGLPGGAVRVDPDALHSRLRQVLVSAAGPLANVIVALPLLAVLVLVGPRAGTQVAFWSGGCVPCVPAGDRDPAEPAAHPWAGWLWDGGAVAAAALGALALGR
jgi:Zn-dependent protease